MLTYSRCFLKRFRCAVRNQQRHAIRNGIIARRQDTVALADNNCVASTITYGVIQILRMNGTHLKLCLLVFGVVILYEISIHLDRFFEMCTVRNCRAKEIFDFTIQGIPSTEHITIIRRSRQCLFEIVRIAGINHIISSRYSCRTYGITTLRIAIFIFFYRFERDIQVCRFGFELSPKLSRLSNHVISQR